LPAERLVEQLAFGCCRLLNDPGGGIENQSPALRPAGRRDWLGKSWSGKIVDASRVLFQLADTSRMWLTLNASVEDAGKLALGQTVRFRPDGSRDEVSGTLVWISTTADQQTRMVTVRAELPNPTGQLRNETFAAGRIILREEQRPSWFPTRRSIGKAAATSVFVRQGYFDNRIAPRFTSARCGWGQNGRLATGYAGRREPGRLCRRFAGGACCQGQRPVRQEQFGAKSRACKETCSTGSLTPRCGIASWSLPSHSAGRRWALSRHLDIDAFLTPPVQSRSTRSPFAHARRGRAPDHLPGGAGD
jgi:hypothetical protein